MLRVQWTISLTSGPVVGTARCPDVAGAVAAVEAALRAAVRDWSTHHDTAVRQLARTAAADAPAALENTGEWRLEAPAVAVILTRA